MLRKTKRLIQKQITMRKAKEKSLKAKRKLKNQRRMHVLNVARKDSSNGIATS